MARAARNPETGTTDKEEAFCQAIAYNPELNDSNAYREAYDCSRMKPETVNKKANELKNKAHIAARIALLREERSDRTKIDADYVLNRHAAIDKADWIEILNDDLTLKPLSQWPKVWRQYLSAAEISELFEHDGNERKMVGLLKKIKFVDKLKNLELMGKHVDVQAYKEKKEIEHTVKKSLQELLAEAASE